MPDLDQNTWKSKLKSEKDFQIIDVRTPEEYEDLRIPNSINIDFYNPGDFMTNLIMFIVEQVLEVQIHVN